MLLVGIPNKESIDGVINLIKKYSIGGIILYKNNYNNLEELKELITKLKEANKNNKLPLTIAIDQEGGRVNRLPNEFKNTLSLYNISKSNNENIKLYANTVSDLLSNLGINMNFAPVLDLKMHSDNHAIGNRAISSDKNRVTEVANIICEEFKKNSVVPVIKHFPGQGSVKMDSHIFLPIIYNYKKILENDSIPFKNMIEKGIDAIMVGHILILSKTNLHPASISKRFINNELKKHFKYNNIIITDELNMRSIRYLYGKNIPIIKAFKANNDIMCCKYKENYIENIINLIEKNIDNNKISISSINESINKIINIKEKYNYNDNTNYDKISIEKYNDIIDKINKNSKNL